MLMTCCELQKLESHHTIEGDSFPTIQGRSSKFKYPWKLADWVKEVHRNSNQLRCRFQHVRSGANEIADGLARERALS